MKDWLFMLFLRGEADLVDFGEDLLAEASRVGSSDRVAVVAELVPPTSTAETRRGPINAGRDELAKIGFTDGSPEEIVSFVRDSKAKNDARNRALILWDHGNGWQNVHVFNQVVTATREVNKRDAIAYEAAVARGLVPQQQRRTLFVSDLRAVLDQEHGINVVGFDACLMSMIEVAFQLRETAQFMVASQHVVPASRGWAYEALLRTVTLDPRIGPEAVVRAMVDTFAGSYNGSSDAVTLTGLRLSAEVDRAVAAIDGFSDALLEATQAYDKKPEGKDVRGEIVLARRLTQSFGNPDYIDIVSFCEQIVKRGISERLERLAGVVKTAIDRLVVRHTRSNASSLSDSHGVSIYFPEPIPRPLDDEFGAGDTRIAASYDELDFADPLYCRWAIFLDVIIKGMTVENALKVERGRKKKEDAAA